MNSGGISTRRHILDTVVEMLAQRDSIDIHLADVAEKAHVGVQTIYYHFDSRVQLIAEAQSLTYSRLNEPLLEYLRNAERAVDDDDPVAFFDAVGDHVALAWSLGLRDERWRTIRLLIDVSQDPFTRRQFWDSLESQFQRWIVAIEAAQALGWVKRDIDASAFVSSINAAPIGQALFVKSSKLHYTPQSMREFVIAVAAQGPHTK